MSNMDGVAFTFRQRAGRLDWKVISSIDLDEVIINLRVNELQAVLDSVTFSEIVPQDIKHNTIDHVSKLIQVMQLVIEYLLHHQEAQYSLVTKLNHKINKLKESREKYYKENLVYREDVKTYQRQLHILRKAVNGGELHGDYLEALHRQRMPAKVYGHNGRYSEEDKRDDHKDLVKTILDYERESRNSMMSMLEDQRRTFSQEMLALFESLKQQANNGSNNTPNNQLYMENIKLQIDNILHNALDSYKENIGKTPLQRSFERPKAESDSNKVHDVLREAALETMEDELRQKARELTKREEALKLREEAMSRKEKFASVLRHSSDAPKTTSSLQDAIAKRRVGITMMKTIFNNFRRRRCNSFFRKWHGWCVELRNREIYEEQGRMLLYANSKKTEYEEVLMRQLEEERAKQTALQSKYQHVSLEMEVLQEKLAAFQQSRNAGQHMEMELSQRLKEEQDKNIVLNAKYSSLLGKSEREKVEWMDKLHRLEMLGAHRAPAQRETSIMTSVDFGTSKSSSSRNILLSLLPKEFLSKDFDEDALLRHAEHRVANKNSKDVMEDLVMKTLAKDFVHKLSEEGAAPTTAMPSAASTQGSLHSESTAKPQKTQQYQQQHYHNQHQPRQRQPHHQPLIPPSSSFSTSSSHFDYEDNAIHVPILR